MAEAHDRLADTVRIEGARVLATLVRTVGSLSVAEDAVQDAVLAALRDWPRTGVPDEPRAWLTVTARRKAIDILRRESARATKERDGSALMDPGTADLPSGGRRARRPAPTHLHLLPPRPGSRRSGGTGAAHVVRPVDGAGRRGAADHRGGDGQAADPHPQQDQRRADPVHGAVGRGPARTARRRLRRGARPLHGRPRAARRERPHSTSTSAPRPCGSVGFWSTCCPTNRCRRPCSP